jgi:hypothetical protein
MNNLAVEFVNSLRRPVVSSVILGIGEIHVREGVR